MIEDDSEEYSQSPSSPVSELSGASPSYTTPLSASSLPDLSLSLADATSQAHWGSLAAWKPARRFTIPSVVPSPSTSSPIQLTYSEETQHPLPISQRVYLDSRMPSVPQNADGFDDRASSSLADLAHLSRSSPLTSNSRDPRGYSEPRFGSAIGRVPAEHAEGRVPEQDWHSPRAQQTFQASQSSQRIQTEPFDPTNWTPVSRYLAPYFDSGSAGPRGPTPAAYFSPGLTPTQERPAFIQGSEEGPASREAGQSTARLPIATYQPRREADPDVEKLMSVGETSSAGNQQWQGSGMENSMFEDPFLPAFDEHMGGLSQSMSHSGGEGDQMWDAYVQRGVE